MKTIHRLEILVAVLLAVFAAVPASFQAAAFQGLYDTAPTSTVQVEVTKTPTATVVPVIQPTPLPTNSIPGTVGAQTSTTLLNSEPGSAIYSLSELTGIGDIVLQGVTPSYSFYLPLPKEWKMKSVVLHLEVTHSEVLRTNSSLTILVNEAPVGSIKLTPSNSGPTSWDVTIPPEMLQKESIIINFVGTMRISDQYCNDEENTANWSRISGKSKADFAYDLQPVDLSFEQFPYPIIRVRSLTADQIVIVVPKNASSEEISSLLNVSSALGSLSSWRGLNLYTTQTDQYSSKLKSQYDAVLVGTVKQLDLKNFGVKWDLAINAAGKLVVANGAVIPDDTGVLMIARSPWAADKGILAVTGQTAEAVTKAALALRHSQFANLTRGKYVLVPTMAEDVATTGTSLAWDNTSLASLGYTDQTVHGIGKQRITIPLELPSGLNPKEITARLVFSHAPFVSTDRSYLVLSANGIPQSGLFLKTENEQRGEWTVKIPASQLVPGKNILEATFDLHMAGGEVCTDDYFDKAWGVLHKDSSLQVSFDSSAVTPDLFFYPVPFGANTVAVVSNKIGSAEQAGTFQMFSQLGKLLGSQARYLEIIPANQADSEALAGRDLILIGEPANNPIVAEALKTAPIKIDSVTRNLDTNLFNLAVADGEPVGLLQEFSSPWDKNRTVLLVTGTSDDGVGWAASLLGNPSTQTTLKGDVAIVDGSNTLTMVNSKAPETSKSPVTPTQVKSEGPSRFVLWIVTAAILVIIVVALIVLLVRRRTQEH